jgi:hypothetical protein
MDSPRCWWLVAKPPRQQFVVAETLAGALRYKGFIFPNI